MIADCLTLAWSLCELRFVQRHRAVSIRLLTQYLYFRQRTFLAKKTAESAANGNLSDRYIVIENYLFIGRDCPCLTKWMVDYAASFDQGNFFRQHRRLLEPVE
jgi:hypothetical protein